MSAADELIDRLNSTFGEPKTPDPERFLIEFAKAMKGWDPLVLERAGDEVIKECVYWPKPAEVIERARRIAGEMYRARPAEHERDTLPEPTPEQKARVQVLVDSAKRVLTANAAAKADPAPLPDVSRPAFEKMQRESPNTGLHRKPATLTHLSRRMSGDTQ